MNLEIADRIAEAMALAVVDGLVDESIVDKALDLMEEGRENIDPQDAEVVDLLLMVCLAYYQQNVRPVTDDMVAEFFRTELGEQ